mgnify:CR=1 FL=1
MKLIKLIILSIVCVSIANAQQTPAEVQSKTVAIVGGTAHLGNGSVIQNSLIIFEKEILQTDHPKSGYFNASAKDKLSAGSVKKASKERISRTASSAATFKRSAPAIGRPASLQAR